MTQPPAVDHSGTWDVAQACREGVNRAIYGGDAPHDSNALTEVWRTRTGAGFEFEHHGRKFAVVIAPAEAVSDDLIRPDWG